MNLAVITNLFPSPLEPMRSTFNEQQILAMNRAAHVVGVMVPVDWRRMLGFWRSGRHAALRGVVDWKGIRVVYPTYFYLPRLAGWLNGVLMFLSLLPQWLRLRRQRPEAIFATWAFPDGFAAVLLGLLSGVRVVVKVHGSDVEVLEKEWLRRVLTVWALNRAVAVISVSKNLQDRLVKYGVEGRRVLLVYNGIDRERFRPLDRAMCRRELGLAGQLKVVLYAGNLKKDKGVMDLLEAVAPLCRTHGIHTFFIGDGPARDELESRISAHGISSHVQVLGKMPHDRLPLWMNAADVLCLPSHHEGVPNVILEATACGTPVVATAVGGLPEVVTPASGRLVPAHDTPALQAALCDSLERTWDRDAVRAALIVNSWDDNANRIIRILDGAT